jgi:hypothetical protein
VNAAVSQFSERTAHVVWAKLCVSRESEREVREFLAERLGFDRRGLNSGLHLTVYHARRVLPGLRGYEERADVEIDPAYLRFMVMAPGGENPRADVDPLSSAIGVRVKRSAPATEAIRGFRGRFFSYETVEVLGSRKPSTNVRNAFGARHFQPHITLLKKDHQIDRDLTSIGEVFRSSISPIRFDRFVVTCRSKLVTVG